jgi:hypothetical protein
MWPSVVGVSRPCLAFRPCPIFPPRRGPCARPWTGAWCERDVGSTQREPRPPTPSRRRAATQHNLTKISALNLKSDSDTLTSGPDRRRRVRSDRLNRAANRQALIPLIRHISEPIHMCAAKISSAPQVAPRETREACAASVVDQKILCVLDSQNASGKSQKPRLDQSSPGSGRRPARDRRPSE